jgi:hypothetical protein
VYLFHEWNGSDVDLGDDAWPDLVGHLAQQPTRLETVEQTSYAYTTKTLLLGVCPVDRGQTGWGGGRRTACAGRHQHGSLGIASRGSVHPRNGLRIEECGMFECRVTRTKWDREGGAPLARAGAGACLRTCAQARRRVRRVAVRSPSSPSVASSSACPRPHLATALSLPTHNTYEHHEHHERVGTRPSGWMCG